MEWKENPKSPFRVLVKYATRGRSKRFFEGMESIYKYASLPDAIMVLITADTDDSEMNNDEVKERIAQYQNAHIIFGESKSKIDAINRDMDIMPDEWKDWDIIVNFSDDMRFTIFGWDDIIRTNFNDIFPVKMDGYMAYLDPDTKGALSTLLIAGRGWYNKFNFIYDPQFYSLFCDNLVEDCAKYLGLYHYTGFSIYQHFNPAYYPEYGSDAQFIHQQTVGYDIDGKLYHEIMAKGITEYLKQFNL